MFLTKVFRQMTQGRTLYVGNLSWITSEKELVKHFRKFGVVRNIQLFFDKNTALSREFAFVTFARLESATKALMEPTHLVDEKMLVVSAHTSRRRDYPDLNHPPQFSSEREKEEASLEQ